MRAYESMIIFDPSCTNEEIEGEINKLSDIITHENGKVIEINRWGKKKLAYEIKKKNTGFFVVFQFVLSPEKIGKFKNYFKFNNLVLRYNLLKIELEGEMPFSSYENEDGGGKNNE